MPTKHTSLPAMHRTVALVTQTDVSWTCSRLGRAVEVIEYETVPIYLLRGIEKHNLSATTASQESMPLSSATKRSAGTAATRTTGSVWSRASAGAGPGTPAPPAPSACPTRDAPTDSARSLGSACE